MKECVLVGHSRNLWKDSVSIMPLPERVPESSKMTKTGGSSAKLKEAGKPVETLPCPRCDSMNTKFCYYNNYSVTQPRHFCRQCQRYWTAGGTLRNVPVGGGSRKKNRGPRIEPYHPHRMHMMPGSMPGGYLPQFVTPEMVPHYGMMYTVPPPTAAAASPVPLQTRPATPGLTFELNLHATGADSQSNNPTVPSPVVKTASPPHGSSTIEEEGSTPTNGYSTSGYEEGDAVSSMWHEMHDMDNILFQ